MNEMMPFISVVIPTCDRPATLITAIKSIKANDYPLYEIIVVDQSSDNKSEKVIREFADHAGDIVYLHSDVKCSSDSRNRGWQRAKGAIIAFTDDDAFVDEGWLKAIAEAFTQDDGLVGMIGGRIMPIFQRPRPSWLPPERDFLLPSFNAGNEKRPFPEGSLPISVNLAVSRSLLEKSGGFDTRLGLKKDDEIPYIGGEDSLLAIKVRNCGGSILYQPSAIVYHPVTAERLTRCFFLKRHFREGVTTIAMEDVQSLCTEQQLTTYIVWHLKNVIYRSILFCKDFVIPRRGRSMAYMLRASEIAFSIGVIHHSRYLRRGLKRVKP